MIIVAIKKSFEEKEIKFFDEDEITAYNSCKSLVGQKSNITFKGLFRVERIKSVIEGFDYQGAVPLLVFKKGKKKKAIKLSSIYYCKR